MTSSFSRHRQMKLFLTVEHPSLNVSESNISDCECIIDSSAGLVWKNSCLNIFSRISLSFIHVKSRKWSHNFASLSGEFSLLPSLYTTLSRSSIISSENSISLMNIYCFLSEFARLLLIMSPSAFVYASSLSLIKCGFSSMSHYMCFVTRLNTSSPLPAVLEVSCSISPNVVADAVPSSPSPQSVQTIFFLPIGASNNHVDGTRTLAGKYSDVHSYSPTLRLIPPPINL